MSDLEEQTIDSAANQKASEEEGDAKSAEALVQQSNEEKHRWDSSLFEVDLYTQLLIATLAFQAVKLVLLLMAKASPRSKVKVS